MSRKFAVQSAARPASYDRNPVAKPIAYVAAGVAPHGSTQRWTYTVPAGKKFQLGSAQVSVLRRTVPAPANTTAAWIEYTPSGGAAVVLLRAVIVGTTVGERSELAIAPGLVMTAGDNLAAYTLDNATGGTDDYNVLAGGTEFDA